MKKLIPTALLMFYCVLLSASCRVDTIYHYNFDSSLTIKRLSYREINRYNTSNMLQETQFQSWKTSSQSWEDYSTDFYSYDLNNNSSQILSKQYNSVSGLWSNRILKTMQYDNSNNRIEQLERQWNDSSSSWINSYRYQWMYTGFNKQMDGIEQRWSTTSAIWMNVFRVQTFYDSTELITEYIFQNKGVSATSWDNSSRYIFHYDANHRVVDEYGYGWILTGNSGWIMYRISYYSYDANNNIILKLKLATNSDSTIIGNQFRDSFVYDGNNMCTEFIRDSWYDSTWQKYSKTVYEFDTNRDTVSCDYYSKMNHTGDYESRSRAEYICTGVFYSINDLDEDAFEIFPNPNIGNALSLNVNTKARFVLSDINGSPLQIGELNKGENTVALNGLSSGIYLMKIGEQTKRFVIP